MEELNQYGRLQCASVHSTLPLFIMLVLCIFTLMLLSIYYTCSLFPQCPQLALLMDLLPFFSYRSLLRRTRKFYLRYVWVFCCILLFSHANCSPCALQTQLQDKFFTFCAFYSILPTLFQGCLSILKKKSTPVYNKVCQKPLQVLLMWNYLRAALFAVPYI